MNNKSVIHNICKRYARWFDFKLNRRSQIMGLRFTVTWKCNSRCITCAIWKEEDAGKNDLSVQEIDQFSQSKYFRNLEYITISGGEPTLRSDLPDIISVLHKNIPNASFSITTHGMNPQTEERMFKKILNDNPGVRFSLVGISLNGPPDVHDLTRGIEGSWDKAVESYERLKNIVHCEFSFTFCRHNVDHFEWVCDFAKQKGTKAYICWTVMNSRFNITDEDLVFWKPGMGAVLQKYVDQSHSGSSNFFHKLINAVYLDEYINFSYLYDNIINRRVMPCFAGRQIVHVAPNGDVYPCNFKLTDDRIMGNLRENDFDTIWESIKPDILGEITRGDCMYPNGLCGDSEIYPSVRNSCPPVLMWYLRKIFRKEPLIREPVE